MVSKGSLKGRLLYADRKCNYIYPNGSDVYANSKSLVKHEMHGQYIFTSHRIKFIEHDLQYSHPKGSIFAFEEKEVMCLCHN